MAPGGVGQPGLRRAWAQLPRVLRHLTVNSSSVSLVLALTLKVFIWVKFNLKPVSVAERFAQFGSVPATL